LFFGKSLLDGGDAGQNDLPRLADKPRFVEVAVARVVREEGAGDTRSHRPNETPRGPPPATRTARWLSPHAEGRRRSFSPLHQTPLEPASSADARGEPAVRLHHEGDLRRLVTSRPLEPGRAPWRHRLPERRSRISAAVG